MTFAITLPQPGDRYFFIPAVPAGFLSPPLADAVGRYVTLYTGPARDDYTDDPWGAAARDIAEHVATSCNELAVKLLFIAHYDQPERVNGQVAIDLEAFDVDTGRAIVRAAADALAIGRRSPAKLARQAAWDAASAALRREVERDALVDARHKEAQRTGTMTDELKQEWSDSAEPLTDAEWALFDTPAPDHAAVEWKMDFLVTRDGFDADRAARIIADVQFLRSECEA